MVRTFVFSTQGQLRSQGVELSKLAAVLADPGVFVWVDLEAATPAESEAALTTLFHFHPLSIEDCVLPSPLPKVEEYNPGPDDKFSQYVFMIIHAVDYHQKDGVFATSELDFFLGKSFLVTYHDEPLRAITSVEERCLRGTLGTARAPDRIAHILLDGLVENYRPALDSLSLEISKVEQNALESPQKETLNKIFQIKKEVLHLRQIIGPQSNVLARLAHGEFKLIRPSLAPYFRDVHDSLSHMSDRAQSYADSLTSILQVYLNMSSNETGEVIKLLTLITLITTPLMMIGTWYGMNFHDMPELVEGRHGYTVAVIAMVLSTVVTYWYFKKRKWF